MSKRRKMMSISKVQPDDEDDHKQDLAEGEISESPTGSKLIEEIAEEDAKNISRQLVDLEILYLLNFGPKSGYQLKKSLYSSFQLNLSYGTLYPHLHSLDRAQLVSGTWKYQSENAPLRKRMYSLTPKGAAKLSRSIGNLSKIALTMQFMFSHLDLNPKKVVTPDEKSKLDHAIKTAADYMHTRGYSTTTEEVMRGFSGLEHVVDLHATKPGDGGREDSVILKFANSGSGLSLEDLFKVYVMSYDLKATKAIVLSTPTPAVEVIKLADFYSVPVYSGNDLEEAIKKMMTNLDLP
jgi:DNA-binding PadR family transcriptional regulator